MSDILKDLEIEIDGLRYEIADARKNVKDFSKRHFNGTREEALVLHLEKAAAIAEGCDVLVKVRLLTPLYTLTRSLLESLFWVCWIIKSDENTQVIAEAASNELKRIARINLQEGYAKVRHRETGEDNTKELLADWDKETIPPRPNFFKMAEASGLKQVYRQMYGPLSMQAHGNVFGLDWGSGEKGFLEVMALANVVMECINLVVKTWIVERKQLSVRKIYAILGYTGKQGGAEHP